MTGAPGAALVRRAICLVDVQLAADCRRRSRWRWGIEFSRQSTGRALVVGVGDTERRAQQRRQHRDP